MILIQLPYNAIQRNIVYFYHAKIIGNRGSMAQQNHIIRQSTFRSISTTAVSKQNKYDGLVFDVTPYSVLHYP